MMMYLTEKIINKKFHFKTVIIFSKALGKNQAKTAVNTIFMTANTAAGCPTLGPKTMLPINNAKTLNHILTSLLRPNISEYFHPDNNLFPSFVIFTYVSKTSVPVKEAITAIK